MEYKDVIAEIEFAGQIVRINRKPLLFYRGLLVK